MPDIESLRHEAKKMKRIAVVLSVALLMLWSGPVHADLYQHVEINVSALAGRDIALDFALFNNNGDYESWVLVDNIQLDGVSDFEGEDALDAWYSWIPPLDSEVTRELGTLTGEGEWVMKIGEGDETSPCPVIADTDFLAITGTILSFDIQTHVSSDESSGWLDEFVVTIYDWTGDGEAYGDIYDAFVANADGIASSRETTVSVVPAPAALLLGLLGFGASGLGLWRGRTHLV